MIFIFYNLALLSALAASAPWWLWKMATTHKYREGLRDRMGQVPVHLIASSPRAGDPPVLWLHAVSVGEVLAVTRLVAELDRAFPAYKLLISTTTRTGQALARQRFGAQRVFYCPLDLPWAVSAYLNALRPRMLILAETEFWPNLLNGCFRRQIPVAVVNARISNRSWPRYQFVRRFWKPILERLSLVLAQSEADADRLKAIGCRTDRVSVAGNLKFDVRAAQEAEATRQLKSRAAGLRFVVAGSTLEREEAALLEAWPELLAADPNLLLVIAPRHPERFSAVAALLEKSGFPWIRRSAVTPDSSPGSPATGPLSQGWRPAVSLASTPATVSGHDFSRAEDSPLPPGALAPAGQAPLRSGAIVLLDTIGELASVYSLASVAFVGGSLFPHGGHNPLEPAQFGVPIVMGPHYANFTAITDDLRAQNALRIATRDNLAATLIHLLTDRPAAESMGARAKEVFDQQAGATDRCLKALRAVLAAETGVKGTK